MVIQEFIKDLQKMDGKKYVIHKNHIREVSTEQNIVTANEAPIEMEYTEDKNNMERITRITSEKIDPNDLEELRKVYNKCKSVMRKIEKKYGHLLDLDSDSTKKRKAESSIDQCTCEKVKKIIFDDAGKQTVLELPLTDHICPKKLILNEELRQKVDVESSYTEEILPDDITILLNILKDPTIETTYRNRVIGKLLKIRQDLAYELKYNKQSLVESSKSNPEDVFDFVGTNFLELPGYKK